jgi:hypothetical protein
MAPKKRPQPLHKSLRLIEEERANVVKRTQVRIAQLIAEEEANVVQDEEDNIVPVPDYDRHCYLNTVCCMFCMLLVVMNLLFLQWLYYKVHDFKVKQM